MAKWLRKVARKVCAAISVLGLFLKQKQPNLLENIAAASGSLFVKTKLKAVHRPRNSRVHKYTRFIDGSARALSSPDPASGPFVAL